MNVNMILQMLVSTILPAIWVAAGPLLTTSITAFVNSVVGKYVPRPVQVILSGALGAVVAGLTGEMQGVDPNVAASIGLSTGVGAQTLASLHPNTLLASPPPTTASAPVTPHA